MTTLLLRRMVPGLWPFLLAWACGGCAVERGVKPADRDGDRYWNTIDCDDEDPNVNPESPERCDGVDNNCDGDIDGADAVGATRWFGDADGDGYGDPDYTLDQCAPPEGWVGNGEDCDDSSNAAYPGATEVCDRFDNDCDGSTDEEPTGDSPTWYGDLDGDGSGDPLIAVTACEAPDGYVANADDCRDDDPQTYPDAPEICDEDGFDEDCDGLANNDDDDAADGISLYQDEDGDGHGDPTRSKMGCSAYAGWTESRDDCDDADGRTYAGAAEACGDGVDQDCDGLADEDGVVLAWYADVDSDGYGDPEVMVAESCTAVPGASVLATDCDDADATISPAAIEIWYDGVDQDCDGASDDDADRDGVDAEGAGGLDCDDLDAAVGPAEVEQCGDGVDNNCDTILDPCSVTFTGRGTGAGARAGTAVALVDDQDGDGGYDLGIGAPWASGDALRAGAVYLLTREDYDDRSVVRARATWSGDAAGDHAGAALVALPDADGDGITDLAIGASRADGGGRNAGLVVVVSAAGSGAALLSDADLALDGEAAGDEAGSALAGIGDIDGDGLSDLGVGGPTADGAGAVWLLAGLGALGEDLTWARLKAEAETAGDEAGAAISGGADVDGDGVPDVLVGAPLAGDAHEGRAYLISGDQTGTLSLADADATWSGDTSGDGAGAAVALGGDLDGDGITDLLIGAPQASADGVVGGSAWIISGSAVSGALAARGAGAIFGAGTADALGSSLAGLGDLDGDGFTDLAVGAPGADRDASDAGGVWVGLGPLVGTVRTTDLSAGWSSASDSARAASTLAAGQSAEGTPILLVGGPLDDGAAEDAGAVWTLDFSAW